jgi:hypothetical protein
MDATTFETWHIGVVLLTERIKSSPRARRRHRSRRSGAAWPVLLSVFIVLVPPGLGSVTDANTTANAAEDPWRSGRPAA